jgi:hypothetical protein
MSPAITIFAACFCVTSLASFVFFERLLKRQYSVAREAWEADGRAPGFFWAGEGTSTLRFWARSKVMFLWLVGTPDWIRADAQARATHRSLRVTWVLSLVVWFGLITTMFVR